MTKEHEITKTTDCLAMSDFFNVHPISFCKWLLKM